MITALTIQDTAKVHQVLPAFPSVVHEQLRVLLRDLIPDAVKIGMLGSPTVAHAVADLLEGVHAHIVFDPVMVSTSGSVLADADTIAAFERLMAMASITTPNVPELDALGGVKALQERSITFLAKGGDAPGDTVTDRLYRPGEDVLDWAAPRIETRHTHGTGCTTASAIACGLGAGLGMVPAIEQARAFVRAALEAAPGFGAGHGPLGHQAVR